MRKAIEMTHIRGWISDSLPRASLMSVQLMKPAPMPTVMSYVSGIRIIVSSAGRPSSTSATGMSRTMVNIR